MVRLRLAAIAVSLVWGVAGQLASITTTAADNKGSALNRIDHIVVIYQENHSFDNLYGGWEGVNGRANADQAHTSQIKQDGTTFTCLLQNDVNLASPPLSATCADTIGTPANTSFSSHFTNAPFAIDAYIPPGDTTCPPPGVFAPFGVKSGTGLAGGCTRDIVHRFYQEQYQLDGGRQDRYTTGSDAAGLTQGYYNTQALPIYAYLHQDGHPHYAIADDFFQAAFGGSFLNHQWLIAAATPTWPGAPAANHSVIDANGMPTTYPLYAAGPGVRDRPLTVACPSPVAGRACGDYAINTIQPTYQPHGGGAQLPPQTATTIGDELSAAGVSWAWYAGGWTNAEAGNPDPLFQFHHQPFNYYLAYAPGTAARQQHLRDETEFLQLANSSTNTQCNLNGVSFVKPIGEDNEHPGYTGESAGSNHLVQLLRAIEGSACRKDTMVVVTYDEFGGQWDHVTPPGQGGQAGPHDLWGPGTRVPALIVSPFLRGTFVIDHAQHDTTSILATIEHRFGVAALGSRDAAIQDLSTAYTAKAFDDGGSD